MTLLALGTIVFIVVLQKLDIGWISRASIIVAILFYLRYEIHRIDLTNFILLSFQIQD